MLFPIGGFGFIGSNFDGESAASILNALSPTPRADPELAMAPPRVVKGVGDDLW